MNLNDQGVRIGIALAVTSAMYFLSAGVASAQLSCGEWTQVDPPTGATSAVTEVQARSATDAFAFAIPLGLIRWDGAAWSQLPITNPYGEYPIVYITEFGLVGPSHLALAGMGSTGPFSTDQVLRFWDGTSWSDWESLTLQPNIQGAPRNGSASAVVGVSPDDVWILGEASGFGDGVSGEPLLTVHWDGTQLTEFVTPGVGNRQNNVYDAVAIASDDAWAVGDRNNFGGPDPTFHGMTFHWDGSTWSPVPNPTEAIDSSHLYAVDAIASNDVWAAGDSPAGPLFMHWDGSSWTIVPSPATTGTIRQLAAVASDDVWAVDHAWQVPVIGKFYHWDGVAWSIVLPPEYPGATAVERHGGLAAVGECDVWAVGSVQFGQSLDPFIERLQPGGGVTAVTHREAVFTTLEVAPNPFGRTTTIRFDAPKDALQAAHVYDVRGRRVRTLTDALSLSGELAWDGCNDAGSRVPGGVYFLRVESMNGDIQTRKVSVVR